MTKTQQRASLVAEIAHRLTLPGGVERVADLVEEWRDRALGLASRGLRTWDEAEAMTPACDPPVIGAQ